MLKYELNRILNDLQKYKGRSKEQLQEYYIAKRLNESLISYYKDLSNSMTYLKGVDQLKVAKNLNKDET